MSPQNPKPTDALRRLESLPSSGLGGTTGDPLPEPPNSPWPRYATIGGIVLLVGAVLWLAFGGPDIKVTTTGTGPKTEDGIDTARKMLAGNRDAATCRSALDQINAQLATDNKRPPQLSSEAMAILEKRHRFDDSALTELGSTSYTRLDAQYLEQCLLLRDAVRAIEPGSLPGVTESTLNERAIDRVKLAFAWAVRQVRLEEPAEVARRIDPMLVPPAFALRRGIGSPIERALVFLTLLEQMQPVGRIAGCLVYCPEAEGAAPTLWAVGVLLDEKPDLYLFDPRLGLPIPSAEGKGVATLAEVVREPKLLDVFQVAPVKYAPAGAIVGKAELRTVVSLSSMAARSAHLQTLLGSGFAARLAVDPEALQKRVDAAATAAGLAAPVTAWAEGTHATQSGEVFLNGPELLRRFYLDEEGGCDRKDGRYLFLDDVALRRFLLVPNAQPGQRVPFARQAAWQLASVPFEAYPPVFQDQNRFPREVGMGQRVYTMFAGPFLRSMTEAGQPRDQILRGRYTLATPGLIDEHDKLSQAVRAFDLARNKGDLGQRIDDWVNKAIELYADEVNAARSGGPVAVAKRAVEEHWRRGDAVMVVLSRSVAAPRLPQLVMQIGLCKHEMAEASRARVEMLTALGQTPSNADTTDAAEKWQFAQEWWNRYASEHGSEPGQTAVRRLRARAAESLGNTAGAKTILRDAAAQATPHEQIAAAVLAGK